MTLATLIDIALENGGSESLYTARDHFLRERTKARKRHHPILTEQEWQTIDICAACLRMPRPLTPAERKQLEGIR